MSQLKASMEMSTSVRVLWCLGLYFHAFGLKLEQANNQIMPNAAVFNGPSQRGEMK